MSENPLPVKIDLEIDLRDVMLPGFGGYNRDGDPVEVPRTLEEALFEAAAQKLADHVISTEMRNNGFVGELRDRARKRLDAVLDAQAADMAEEALAQAFQPVSTFGEPKGSPTTFREYVTKRIKDWLTSPADDRSYTGNRRETNAQKMIKDSIDRKFEKELQAEIEKGKTEALAVVRERASKMMADALGEMAEGES